MLTITYEVCISISGGLSRGRVCYQLGYPFYYSFILLGCNKLQRKLLFADSLAKLPYKIGAIRGILTNLVNVLKEIQFKTTTGILSSGDLDPAFSIFTDLQKRTAGLCR